MTSVLFRPALEAQEITRADVRDLAGRDSVSFGDSDLLIHGTESHGPVASLILDMPGIAVVGLAGCIKQGILAALPWRRKP